MKKPTQKPIQKQKAILGLLPLHDRIVIQEVKGDNAKKTDSGIYLPESTKEDRGAKKGMVVAVGPGRYEDGMLQSMQVRVGDTVLFQWGENITYQGEEYYIVRESEVSAIVI